MILEAVWLKEGKEIFCVDPVLNIVCDVQNVSDVEVYNGYGWYTSANCEDLPDDFVIRVRKEDGQLEAYDDYNFETGM